MGRGDSFGQKKGENREFRYTPPKPYQRQEGGIPVYSPYQAKRYKSLWNRYQAGEALSRRESDQIKDEADRTIEYRFYSKRSNVGYWSVTTGTGDQEIFGEITAGGKLIFPDRTYTELSPRIKLSTYDFEAEYSNLPPNNVADFYIGLPPRGVLGYSFDLDPSTITIEVETDPTISVGFTMLQVFSNSFDTVVEAYEQEGSFTYTFSEPAANYWLRMYIVANPTTPLINSTRFFVSGMQFLGGVPGGYACNCPDYTKTEGALIESLWPSLQSNRSWEDSQAGSPGDCKHMIAAKFLAGEPPDPPTFDTIAPDEVDLSYLKPWNPKRRQGDDFSADLTW